MTAPAGVARLSYTVEEAGEATGANLKEIRRACRDGELHAVKRGKRWLIPVSALAAWVGEDLARGERAAS